MLFTNTNFDVKIKSNIVFEVKLMAKSIFIPIPWSEFDANEMFESGDQVKEVYNIIMKAFYYKFKFEKSKENGNTFNVKQFDLSDVKIFNIFVNDTVDNILDPVARDYVLETVRQIRDNNFKKKSVYTTYKTLNEIFTPQEIKSENLSFMLANKLQIIDFCRIFKKCNKEPFTKESNEIKEILTTYNNVIREHAKQSKLL